MKKGLRRRSGALLLEPRGVNRSPDEEGITTTDGRFIRDIGPRESQP